MHGGEADALARLAGECVIQDRSQRLISRQPLQGQTGDNLAQPVERPSGLSKEAMEAGHIPAFEAAGGEGDSGNSVPPQAMHPACHHRAEIPEAGSPEAGCEGYEQRPEGAR